MLRRLDIAEDTVDLMLLKAEVVVDFSVFQPLVAVLRTADTEEVVRLLMLFHAVVMTVLIPSQLERYQECYHHSMEWNQVSDYFGNCFCQIFHDKRMERSENSDEHQLEWYQDGHQDRKSVV